MGIKFKQDDMVQQVVPTIQGKIVGVRIVDNDLAYDVSYINEQGEEHTRCFREDEIKLVE